MRKPNNNTFFDYYPDTILKLKNTQSKMDISFEIIIKGERSN